MIACAAILQTYSPFSMVSRTASEFRKRIAAIHAELGIAESYALDYGLPLQEECGQLADAGLDIFGRPARLQHDSLQAWLAMKQEAAAKGVVLHMVSAFRSADYQKGIFERKLARGDSIGDILRVNAAPGFSEHHTGQAIDIGTDGVGHLTEAFEQTQAFAWLMANAHEYGFSLSFPRNNTAGLLYEPWHWKFSLDPRGE